MKKEIRKIQYDDTLQVEACYFSGIAQPFPNHFHEYYVIGLVEKGKRQLSCKNKTYTIEDGVILLFNPKDNHACVQSDDGTMTYYGLHIPKESMLALTEKINLTAQLYEREGHYALSISGKYPHQSGKGIAAKGRFTAGCRHADRFFRPEPFYKLFQLLHWADTCGLSGNILREKQKRRET